MQCPFCKETIIDGAIKCKHCGSMLTGPALAISKGVMPAWQAILITALLFGLSLCFAPLGTLALVFVSSIWAAVDASSLGTRRYRSSVASTPGGILFGCLLLWIVVFPWYLCFRSKVQAGVAQVATEPEPSVPDIDPQNDTLNS